MSDARLIEITCEVLRDTAKAFQISDGATQAWVPKSQVEWHPGAPGKKAGTMVMPEWLAKDKGLI
jgi:hypothetical protein